MKRKLFVAIIAIVLVTAIVGSCFALYKKDATPRSISLSTGDAVTLDISSEQITDGAFSLSGLNPNTDKTLPLTLTASNLAKVEANVVGVFTVTIAAKDNTKDADNALAAAIDVTASGTNNDSSAYSATKAELAAGDEIELTKIPTNLTLTFSIDEISFLAENGAAEGQVTVTLSWTYTNKWSIDANAWYLRGTFNSWNITDDTYKFVPATTDTENNAYELLGVELSAQDQFRARQGESDNWKNVHGDSAAVADSQIGYTGDNCLVNESGVYNFYINKSGDMYVAKVTE